ncbi:sensor histidine kinase [Deminuibacter soli]|uniref:Histidine kinase domain-containing protein n=1 Tax=Deminuibacter soli TaxID=2291815 RepID=A0A3E1NPY7_9BACT|nr:ATP-binding protein [Deminuibacter soli]RFM29983.1 hypothetical protein DXN05_03150 [Deminuibacter soli]
MLQAPQYTDTVIIVASAVLVFFLVFFYLFILQLHRRRILHQKEMFNLKVQYEQVILQAQLEIQEQTFRNISQEIHDNIGQVLSLAKLNLNILHTTVGSNEQLDVTEQLLGKAIADLRDLSKSLLGEKITDLGLVTAIENELKLLGKTLSIQTRLSYDENEVLVNDEQTIVVFRMVQEIFNNCLKHAKASLLAVNITTTQEKTCISIADNGVGFDMDCLDEKKTGIGLKSMQQRAHLINATLQIHSSPGNGTQVNICLQQTSNTTAL